MAEADKGIGPGLYLLRHRISQIFKQRKRFFTSDYGWIARIYDILCEARLHAKIAVARMRGSLRLVPALSQKMFYLKRVGLRKNGIPRSICA
ncbi:hypothetical protein TWF217_003532 [Orbilia oligospora]|nr:hypothetical protein TWF217_003532 [Orbilia oligospora]